MAVAAKGVAQDTTTLPLLIPTFVKDCTGAFFIVTCGNVTGRLYSAKLSQSKKAQSKCVIVGGPCWEKGQEMEAVVVALGQIMTCRR